MTYFSVVVAVRRPGELADALAPFDHDHQVAPYRRYVEPAELVTARQWAREHPDQVPDVDPDGFGDTAGQARLLTAFLREDVEVAMVDDLPAYFWETTENPAGELSSWDIGGRFSHKFMPRDPTDPRLVRGSGRRQQVREYERGWVDGGPKGALDLAGTRQAAADFGAGLYHRYAELAAAHPPARGWSTFFDRVDHAESRLGSLQKVDERGDPVHTGEYSLEQAGRDYNAQPLVRALNDAGLGGAGGCPVEAFSVGRDAFIAQHRDAAVLGYALITLDGQWSSQGSIGWFGSSDETEGSKAVYQQHANSYLDSVPDDAYLIVITAHN